jgi:hypothetical protein
VGPTSDHPRHDHIRYEEVQAAGVPLHRAHGLLAAGAGDDVVVELVELLLALSPEVTEHLAKNAGMQAL